MGQVLQAGAGQNPAKQSAVAAGIPWRVPADHGQQGLPLRPRRHHGCRAAHPPRRGIRRRGRRPGVDDATRRTCCPDSRAGQAYGSVEMLDHAANDGLTDAFDRESMGASTERFNGRYGITRAEQDEVAAGSHVRAGAARPTASSTTRSCRSRSRSARATPSSSPKTRASAPTPTVEVLGRLRPAFAAERHDHGGQLLAALRRRRGRRRRQPRMGRVPRAPVARARRRVRPGRRPRQLAALAAGQRDRRRPREEGGTAADLDLVEINEAFAAVSLQSARELGTRRSTSSTCTAARSRSATPSAPRARGSRCTPRSSCAGAAAAARPSRSAAAAARARRSCSRADAANRSRPAATCPPGGAGAPALWHHVLTARARRAQRER